jgi:hypothetical protein
MGVAHVGFSCTKWWCGNFHFTRSLHGPFVFLGVALHITIRQIKSRCYMMNVTPAFYLVNFLAGMFF